MEENKVRMFNVLAKVSIKGYKKEKGEGGKHEYKPANILLDNLYLCFAYKGSKSFYNLEVVSELVEEYLNRIYPKVSSKDDCKSKSFYQTAITSLKVIPFGDSLITEIQLIELQAKHTEDSIKLEKFKYDLINSNKIK